jgi:O-antigen ligase
MDPESGLSPSLPVWALLPLVAASIGLVLLQVSRSKDGAAGFVIVALGLRVVLSALHVFSFSKSPIGLSWNALASVAICAGGLLLIRRRSGGIWVATPAVFLIVWMAISSFANQGLGTGTADMIKFAYFAVVSTLVAQACKAIGVQRFLMLILPVACLPLVFQLIGIPLGVVKASESDGSSSYIGGFHHEAAFSVMLITAVLVVALIPRMRFPVRFGLVILCFAALALANYRTSIIGALPTAGIAIFSGLVGTVIASQRKIIGPMLAILLLAAGLALGATQSERYGDLAIVFTRGTDLIQPPAQTSEADGDIMSGRITIWNHYLYGYKDGTSLQKMLGHGPASWATTFTVYAHNTLVSAIYEVGIIGLLAYLFLWAWFICLACLARREARTILLAAHLGFVLLNQATMPLWMIEGVIYYALLCGITVFYFLGARSRRTPSVNHARWQHKVALVNDNGQISSARVTVP